MTRIGLLHPGEMGAAVGAALVAIGHTVVWLPEGRSADTRRRADSAGLTAGTDVADCPLVVSVVPPAIAVATATRVGPFSGLYLDANAISPDTARAVAAVVSANGARYVDGGIIGPPPHRNGTSRLYLSGSSSMDVAELFNGARIETRVLTEGGGTAASALKMTYGAWTKIAAALVLATHTTAAASGVAEALETEWSLSQPDVFGRLESARRAAGRKGWRWADEMREIARTFGHADQPPGFGEAAAAIFSEYPRPDAS